MLIGFGRRQLSGSREDDSDALFALGCERNFIYETSLELADQLAELVDFGRAGDVVAVVHLDRLGRSVSEVLGSVARLDERGMRLSLKECGVIPGTPLGDSFATACRLLGMLEPKETMNGRVRGRGRPTVLNDETQEKALRMLSGNASVLEVARLLRVSPATIYRYFPRRQRKSKSGRV